jgi:hypothetical protein
MPLADKSLYSDIVREIIDFIYIQGKKKKNKHKIKYLIDTVTSLFLDNIKPYLYTILAILLLMFVINCFQFYYYIKLFIKSNNNPEFIMGLTEI